MSPDTPDSESTQRPRKERRVYWTKEEVRQVTLAAADKLIAQNIFAVPAKRDRTGSVFLLEALRAGQQLLPPERRKFHKVNGRAAFGNASFYSRLAAALLQRVRERQAGPAALAGTAAPPAPTSAPPPPAPPALPYPTRLTAAELAGEPPEPGIFAESLPTSELAAALVGRLFEILEARSAPREMADVAQAVAQLREMQGLFLDELEAIKRNVRTIHDAMKAVTAAVPELEAERKRPLRVALIGMRKDQFDFIADKLRGLPVELRHYDANARPVNIQADFACAMRFLWHSWAEKAKACVAPGHFAFLRGGASQVAEQIRVWLGQTGRPTAPDL